MNMTTQNESIFEATCPHCEYQQDYTDPDDEILLCENCGELIYIPDKVVEKRIAQSMKNKKPMSYTRKIWLATILSTVLFFVALFTDASRQSALGLTLNNIGVVFSGAAAIVGWMWLAAKINSGEK